MVTTLYVHSLILRMAKFLDYSASEENSYMYIINFHFSQSTYQKKFIIYGSTYSFCIAHPGLFSWLCQNAKLSVEFNSIHSPPYWACSRKWTHHHLIHLNIKLSPHGQRGDNYNFKSSKNLNGVLKYCWAGLRSPPRVTKKGWKYRTIGVRI